MSAPRPDPPTRRVRPFLLTRGRTHVRAPDELRIETLVQSLPGLDPSAESYEHQVVLCLCDRPVSVAEVSARAHLPLGVVRVLIDDMVDRGTVVVHPTGGERPDGRLLERLLDGLHRL